MTIADLDLFSTSQTKPSPRCAFGSPLVAIINNGFAVIRQACCNHWECPRCGQIRAAQEYRRIVDGAEEIGATHQLYFWTLTCRGKECSLEEAEENYYAWTNVLLTNARTKARRANHYWAYVQVTERQHKTRQHPHSHIITSFIPADAQKTHVLGGKVGYVSQWFNRANLSAGLGAQHQITQVANAAAVSRYVAKYLFKDSMSESWPHKWKRVRYSENWPKLKKFEIEQAIVLNSPQDWHLAERQRVIYECEDDIAYERAQHRIANISRPGGKLTDYLQRSPQFTITKTS